MKTIFIALIRFYQKEVSPLKMPTCRFYPSCSEYFVEALKTRGAVTGSILGIWRILRCNPFCRGGYDPVPPPRRERTLKKTKTAKTAGSAERRSGDRR